MLWEPKTFRTENCICVIQIICNMLNFFTVGFGILTDRLVNGTLSHVKSVNNRKANQLDQCYFHAIDILLFSGKLTLMLPF